MSSSILCKTVGIALLAVVVAVCLDVFFFLDFHRHYFKHHPGECQRIEGAPYGSEDFQILSSGLGFGTSGLASKYTSPGLWDFMKKHQVKGQLFLIDLSVPDAMRIKALKVKQSKTFDPSTFRPHGLSVLEDKVKGQHLIYVVSHIVTEVDHVEKFKFIPETEELEHVASFSSDFIHIGNDLAVTGEDTFYLTNCAYFENKLLGIPEQMLRIRIHDLVYFNGTDFTVSVDGLAGPNGVAVSYDGRHLYLALVLEKRIHVYERASDNSLKLVQNLYMGTGVDNFHLSENGDVLYCACHPKVHKFLQHSEDPSQRAPSQVIRLPLKHGLIQEDEVTELFYDHGHLITGSSVGTVFKNKLYIGSFMDVMVSCTLPN